MARVRWNDFSRGWWPLGPGDDIPKNALREAQGIRPFYGGKTIRSRYGNEAIVTVGAGVQSMFIWHGKIFYARKSPGVLNRVDLSNTTPTNVLTNLSGGPLRFATAIPNPDTDATKFSGKEPGHLFVVGGGLTANNLEYTTSIFPCRKINNAFQHSPMGLDPPEDVWTLGVQAPITPNEKIYSDFELASQWININCATTVGKQHQSGAALQVTVSSNDTGSITRTQSMDWGFYPSPVGGAATPSVKQDWIRLWVHCVDPTTIDKIDLLIDCGGPASVPVDAEAGWEQTFSFTIFVGDGVVSDTTKPKGVTDTTAGADKRDTVPYYAGGVARPAVSYGDQAADPTVAALEVPDAEAAKIIDDLSTTKLSSQANTWTHLRIPKLLFEASSEDMLKDQPTTWSRIRRVRLVVKSNDKGSAVVTFDKLDLHLTVGMQGDYKMALTAHNSVTGTRSMPTAIKEIKNVLRQGLFINNVTVSGETSQYADEIEIWRSLGNGNILFYNKAVTLATIQNNQILDFTADFEGMYDKITIPGLGEMRYLKQVILPQDNVRLSRLTFDIAGPYLGRMWTLAYDQRGRVTYSPPGRMEVAAGYVDVTDETNQMQRVIFWNGIYAITIRNFFRLATQQEPFIFEEINGAPGTIFPDSVIASKFGIVYAHNDGVQLFNGVTSQLFAIEGMEAFFQGLASPATAVLDPTLTQQAFGRNTLFANVHEDEYFLSDGSKTLVVNLRTGVWRTTGIGMGASCEEETFGHLYQIVRPLSSTAALSTTEISTATTDGGNAIPFYIQTSEEKLEDQSGITKIIQRFYFDINTHSQNITAVVLYSADGSVKVLPNINTAVRSLVEFADCLPCDVLSVRLVGSLTNTLEVYEIGADIHLPEQGGQLT